MQAITDHDLAAARKALAQMKSDSATIDANLPVVSSGNGALARIRENMRRLGAMCENARDVGSKRTRVARFHIK